MDLRNENGILNQNLETEFGNTPYNLQIKNQNSLQKNQSSFKKNTSLLSPNTANKIILGRIPGQ